MMSSWVIVGGMMLAAGGLFISLLVLGLAQASARADRDWRAERMERKLDLILTHLGIAHDDHVPDLVIGLAKAGRTQEAIDEYCKATGSSLSVAKREVEWLQSKLGPKTSAGGIIVE